MTGIARGAGRSGAENDLSGEIPAFATFTEDMYFYSSDGSQMDISTLGFRMQFRQSPDQTGADVTLSTTASSGNYLSLIASTSGTTCILRAYAASGTFSAYTGQDMIADLVTLDSTGNTVLYAHGPVSITNNPVTL